MMPADKDISVVICAYTEERWNELDEAVESVRRQTTPPGEIIVVVDHNDTLLERLKDEVQDIISIPNQNRRGLSGARNSGVAAASGEIIAFIDDDAAAQSDWLEILVSHYDRKDVMGVGGAILPHWQSGKPGWFPEEFFWVVGCTYRGMPEAVTPVRNLIGCNMSFRREAFEILGGFPDGIGRIDALPVGCEETEFCIRLRQHWPEKKLVYDPHAIVLHLVPTQRSCIKYFMSRCFSEGISKAKISKLVGMNDGLASERTYTLRTLPKGIQEGGLTLILDRDFHGISKAVNIMIGLCITTIGFLKGMFAK